MWKLLKRAWVAQQRRADDYKRNATPEDRAKTTLAWIILFPPAIIFVPFLFLYRVAQRLIRFTFENPRTQ